MTVYTPDVVKSHYDGGFRKMIDGAPCRVASRRTTDGRYVRAATNPHYDPLYDGKDGISRFEKDAAKVEAAKAALVEKPARKARAPRAAAAAPVVAQVEAAPVVAVADEPAVVAPVAAAVAPVSPDVAALVAALEARIAALEAGRGYSAPPTPANDAVAPPRRSERHAAAIRRAWAVRCAARERADLDRRALEAANGAYRGMMDAYAARGEQLATAQAERDQLAAAWKAARETISAHDKHAAQLRGEVRAATARADRLVTIASAKRRDALRARDDAARAAQDVAGARAETRALMRRHAALQDTIANLPPVAAAIVAKRIPAELEA